MLPDNIFRRGKTFLNLRPKLWPIHLILLFLKLFLPLLTKVTRDSFLDIYILCVFNLSIILYIGVYCVCIIVLGLFVLQ